MGRNPGGTARWYSPAGAGTRHLTRGGGSNHLHLLRGKGQNPLEESLLALRSAMASAPLSPCIPLAQPPLCDPRVARTLRRPRAPLLPCPRWLGRDCSWAPGALLRRRLGGRSGCGRPPSLARAGVGGPARRRVAGQLQGGLHRKGRPALSCEASLPPAIDCRSPVPIYKWASPGPGEAPLGGTWGWHVGISLGKQYGPGWPGRRPRSTFARCRMQSQESKAFGGRVDHQLSLSIC